MDNKIKDMNEIKTKRIQWIDWLKVFAIIGVIVLHTSSQFLSPELFLRTNWYIGVIFESLTRYGIILFIMASGFLILRKDEPITNVPRRIKRVLTPFIFWLIIYGIIKYIMTTHTINLGIIPFIIKGFLDPTLISIQFWFVYMIIGLYILAPILSKWLQNVSFKEIEYFLGIWAILSFIHFLGIEFLLYDYLRYFTGAIGYFILGYYLTFKKHPLLKSPKFGLFLFVIGTLIAIIGTIIGSIIMNQPVLWFFNLGDLTPNACLQAIGLFILIKTFNWNLLGTKITKIATIISLESYGVYLSNLLIINTLEKIPLFSTNGNGIVTIIIVSIATLIICNVLIYIMSKIPILKKFTGFKSIL